MKKDLRARIRSRLKDLGLTMSEASRAGGLPKDAISVILRRSSQDITLSTLEALAEGLQTSPVWLAYGVDPNNGPGDDDHYVRVERDLLRRAVEFLLIDAGVPNERAQAVADILPEALEGPPVDAVDRDPFLSFRVHMQLGARKS